MKRLTSDGGSSFISKRLQEVLQLLETEHHVSCAGHPEGHGAVERMNYVVTQVIRGKFAHTVDWPRFVAPTAFAINTTTSRSLGTSPFEVIHGFKPRLPVHDALGTSPGNIHQDETDPMNFSDNIVTKMVTLRDRVRDIEAKIFQKSRERILKNCQRSNSSNVDDYVLVWRRRPELVGL